MKLRDLQKAISLYLYDKDGRDDVPKELQETIKKDFLPRLSIYRNNILFSLLDILTDLYPSVVKVLGGKNFRFFAREYIYENPSTSSNLDHYGETFGHYLDKRAELEEHPYLKDLAIIDWKFENYGTKVSDFEVGQGCFLLWSTLRSDESCENIDVNLDKTEKVVIDPTGHEIKIFSGS